MDEHALTAVPSSEDHDVLGLPSGYQDADSVVLSQAGDASDEVVHLDLPSDGRE